MSAAKLSRRDVTAMAAAAAALAATPAMAAQPHMEAALKKCENALEELKAAASNKGGHRKNAIEHLEYVIQEIKLGIEAAE
jgi:molybdopterin synthase catalytic subunit